MRTRMKTSPRRRKHRRRAFRRLSWLLVLATLLLLLWPRRVTLDGLNSPHAILLRADYTEGSEMDILVKTIIDKIDLDDRLEKLEVVR